nr:enoyl-CoA hydratase/isomerase [Cryptococcus depauperatus CBS 7841]
MPKYLQLTRPAQNVWQIALDSPPDNRIVPGLLEELHEALNRVEAEWRKAGGAVLDPRKRAEYAGKGAGALVFTSALQKFFSNGLDYEGSLKIDNFFEKMYDPVMWRLLTFPLLTVAAINGHVFAGGMILALCCDYRIMTSGIGFMCMSELTFGAPLPNSFSSMLVSRIPHPQHLRDTLLARRWTQKELINIGLIDEVVEQQQVISRAVEYGAKEGIKVASGSWGLIKEGVFRPILESSQSYKPVVQPKEAEKRFWDRIERDSVKAKL